VSVPRRVDQRREPSLRSVERRRWRSEHEHDGEGERERPPRMRQRRDCTSTTCRQSDAPSWTKGSHRQQPFGIGSDAAHRSLSAWRCLSGAVVFTPYLRWLTP
jgi:hypothetical protein